MTPRQRHVLDLLAKRYSNQQIADELGVSLEGAKWHVREILEATGASSREEAAEMWRVENGLPRRLWRMTWSIGQPAALVGGAAALIVVAVAAFVALHGGDDDEAPVAPAASVTVTSTATAGPPATATVASTPTPGAPGPPSRSTGNAFIDGVTASVESNMSPPSTDLAGQSLPCSQEIMNTAPDCPAGAAAGTLVLSIITFQCEIGWNALTPDLRILDDRDRLTLHSVLIGGADYTRLPAANAAPDYWMLFTNSVPNLPPGYAIAVKNDKIVSWGRSCGPFDWLEERLAAGSTGFLLDPP